MRNIGTITKIILLLLFNVVLLIFGLLWFQYLGLIDVQSFINPILSSVGINESTINIDSTNEENLLANIRLSKREQSIQLNEESLVLKETQLKQKEIEYYQKLSEMEQRERILQEKEALFDTQQQKYNNKRTNIEQNSKNLAAMDVTVAVKIIEEYDDQLLIDTLRVTEELAQAEGSFSLVSTWLSMLPSERVAAIQRKMTLKPETLKLEHDEEDSADG